MTIKINFGPLLGWPIIIYTAFDIWGKSGVWLAIGALLCTASASLIFKGKSE